MRLASPLHIFFTALQMAVIVALPLDAASPAKASQTSALRVTYEDAGATQSRLTFQLDELEQTSVEVNGVRYDRFTFDGEAPAGPGGWPELPAVVRHVLIPPQSGVELKVENLRTTTRTGINPFPHQNPLESDVQMAMLNGGAKPLAFEREDLRPVVDGLWPPEPVVLGEPAIMRNYRIIPVTYYPLRWNPRTGELVVTESVDISLDFTSDRNRVNMIADPERIRPSESIDRLVQEMVINPPADDPRRDPAVQGGSVVYVFGTGQSWDQVVAEFAPLIEWRRRQGFNVVVLRQNDVSPNAIRQTLITAYRDWAIPPEYVVICADVDNTRGNATTISYFNHQAGAGNPYESDHDFTLLDGNDILPEATVGRIIYGGNNELRTIINKIVQYESTPFIGEGNQVGWQHRAALASTDYRSGYSSIDIQYWIRQILQRNGYDRINTFFWAPGNLEPNPTQFITDNMQAGVSLLIYRGFTRMNGFQQQTAEQNIRNGRMLPLIMLVTCNTGDYGEPGVWGYPLSWTEAFLVNQNGGTVGAIGTAGATYTSHNNVYSTGVVHALYNLGISHQGWLLMAGKSQLYTHYAGRGDIMHPQNRNMEAWETEAWIFNLMGDPTTEVFSNVPQRLTVQRPENVRVGETAFDVRVLYDRDEDVPAEGVKVCLYKSGQNGPVFQILKKTDTDGFVSFDLDPAWTQSGVIKLTVHGHNLNTVLADYNIGRMDHFIGAAGFAIDDDDDGASRGDGDGTANPTEVLELEVQITNLGRSRPEGALVCELTANHPQLEVVEGAARFDQTPDSGESVAARFVVRIGGGFPHGEKASFRLTATAGNESWASAVAIPVVGPKLVEPVIEWDGAALRPSNAASLFINLRNKGGRASPQLTGTLFSRTQTISVPVNEAAFAEIAPNQTGRSQATFRMSAHPFHLGGQRADLGLAFAAENGYADTVLFSIVVDRPRPGQPFGPDRYGYICFDNTDTSWLTYPRYEWIEINPRYNGEGTNLRLNDVPDRQPVTNEIWGSRDTSALVDLPFTFQYYGERFNRMTVNSNGWIAMSDSRFAMGGRHRQIPGAENPPGMIAPFWADAIVSGDSSGVFAWFDEEDHRFIVEWSNVVRFEPNYAGESRVVNSFQVILHDPQFYPSFTGDGDIIFQYNRIRDIRNSYGWDTPYSTIGICSPNQTDGLEVVYWNARNPGADTIVAGRAIKFTTLVEFSIGSARGTVTDLATGAPVEGALVSTTFGFFAITDANGEYEIPEMLVDTGYVFRASKRFYNDAEVADIEIREGETAFVDLMLAHPEFTFGRDSLTVNMLHDGVEDSLAEREHRETITLQNSGNGQLWFNSRYIYIQEEAGEREDDEPGEPRRDDPDEAWDPLLIFSPGDTLHDSAVQAVLYANGYWYVAAAANRDVERRKPIYRFNRRGVLIDTLLTPFVGPNSNVNPSQYGIRDMDFYDGAIWGACAISRIFRFDPETGDTLSSLFVSAPNFSGPRNIAIDPATGTVYLSMLTGAIRVFQINDGGDTLGVVRTIAQIDPRDNAQIRATGMAWFRDDPDGFNLYIVSDNEPVQNNEAANISIYKLNVNTGEVRYLTNLPGQFAASAMSRLGMHITPKWNNLIWVLALVIDDPTGDKVGVFELAPNSSWLSYEPKSDTIDAGDARTIDFTFVSADLDTGIYGVDIEFSHNADPGRFILPIELHILLELPEEPPDTDTTDLVADREMLARVFGLGQNRPNPFNQQTRIAYSVERTMPVKLTVWDIAGRQVDSLVDEVRHEGRHEIVWRAESIPAGIYFVRLEAGGKVVTRKMALLK
ncbi:MAG: T9SS type A sorting domain-containing protein [Calditrichaeota bacterium]|nr:T9SS type A sorting domain-containing protein [Calditrichota bacterium]